MATRTATVCTAPQEHRSFWRTLVLTLAHVGKVLAALQERRRLAELDERALQDIGLTRSQAVFEASRAPWDLPEIGVRRER